MLTKLEDILTNHMLSIWLAEHKIDNHAPMVSNKWVAVEKLAREYLNCWKRLDQKMTEMSTTNYSEMEAMRVMATMAEPKCDEFDEDTFRSQLDEIVRECDMNQTSWEIGQLVHDMESNSVTWLIFVTVPQLSDEIEAFHVDIHPGDTVRALKERIECEQSFKFEEQILLLGSTSLDNDEQCLSTYNIQPKAVITLRYREAYHPMSDKRIHNLFVEVDDCVRKMLVFHELPLDMPIRTLREEIKSCSGSQFGFLHFFGKPLRSVARLGDYSIRNNSTLYWCRGPRSSR